MREILHCDLNNFYASVECMLNPKLKDIPVAVCGDSEARHGIILAKNYIAKGYGVKTGQTMWEAKKLCPFIEFLTADFDKYLKISREVKKVYAEYSDRVESFGIDEAWIDVTHSKVFGSAKEIAYTIKERIKREFGLTISVGVSFNKVFAKLGSDLKKPDAITEITKENFKDVVWKLPVEELLYVGKATKSKLNKWGITTIGELASTPLGFLKSKLGKWAEYLINFANGNDNSVVKIFKERLPIKSVGNSTTCYRDLYNNDDVAILLSMLAESVAFRIHNYGLFKARTLQLFIRDNSLNVFQKQVKFSHPTCVSSEIFKTAFNLFKSFYDWKLPIRSMGISVTDFLQGNEQLSMFSSAEKEQTEEKIDLNTEMIRNKYGYSAFKRAITLLDNKLSDENIKDEHVIHPVSFFG